MTLLHREPAHEVATTIIESADSSWKFGWAELARYRELLFFFVWRDIKLRYKQTLLGVFWVILQPLAVALVLAAFLGRVADLPSDRLPYPLFAYSGMVLWQLFAQGLAESSNSIVNNEQLITKIYFPRLFVPLSSILTSLIDSAIRLVVLALFLAYFRIAPSAFLMLFPLFALPAVFSALGGGLWLSAINVKYRDVRHIVSFLLQFWFFATPVVYSTVLVPHRWLPLYELNPMTGALDAFRWALRGGGPFPAESFLMALSTSSALLVMGLYYFRKTEETFADFI
jgi:lipopolysaccharide transport system permease protein